ncbi:MAG: potassium transporter Trk [Candidatus Cloacimonetes bacterium]|jgi:trk system potassium uptake protein TrkH|nr:potassium transporter Trk [Candidatus Cloacimonadota bacterium]
MSAKRSQKFLTIVEILAYLLAGWSFFVLFFEGVFHEFSHYPQIEIITALANLSLAIFATILKLIAPKKPSDSVWFDLSMIVFGFLMMFYQIKYLIFILLIRQSYYFLQYMLFRLFEGKLSRAISRSPSLSLMLSFALVIVLGAVLLMMPTASVSGQNTSFIDSLFTATSATCVTGLSVVDIGSHFTLFGQIVILILIQIGALGIMTISTAFALILGRRLNLRLENVMHSVVGGTDKIDIFRLLKSIVLVTITIEALGATLLYFVFSVTMPPSAAIYNSVFHSISAFSNAGISLFKDSLTGYVNDPLLNITIIVLITLGGIGFAVLIDLFRYFTGRDKVRKLSLHTKIVLMMTGAIIILGFLGIFIAEHGKSLIAHPMKTRVLASLFQSITSHTAGFNTMDISQLSPASVFVVYLLMFIGASPGSTGGGVKTTTVALLILGVISMFRGKKEVSLFNRRIPLSNIREATILVTLASAMIFVFGYALMLTQDFSFDDILFETVSAFGTVGLSRGITPELNSAGKLLITLLMYLGRIGPLTLVYALGTRKHQAHIVFAEEKIPIG